MRCGDGKEGATRACQIAPGNLCLIPLAAVLLLRQLRSLTAFAVVLISLLSLRWSRFAVYNWKTFSKYRSVVVVEWKTVAFDVVAGNFDDVVVVVTTTTWCCEGCASKAISSRYAFATNIYFCDVSLLLYADYSIIMSLSDLHRW